MKTGIQLLILIALCFSCKEENIFDIPPSERNAGHINELRKELVSAPHGWFVTYFPRTDSLLFSNVNELITLPRGVFEDRYKYGYGGHCFLMKFSGNGIVETLSDYNEQSVMKSRKSEFEVNQNTFTQLSFTTYTDLHLLVNAQFTGSSDFLYTGKDLDGNLVFKTASYAEPAREYIVFTKLKDKKGWPESIETAYKNKLFFENMKNPQLKISKAGRVYFHSDMKMRTNQSDLTGDRYKRYHLFLEIAYFAPQGWTKEVVAGLGSGYTGTTEGLTFRPGIRYSKTYTFYDFQREGDRFVCELVKVFDTYSKTERWVSKHLAPGGEKTGVVAEIWDNK